MSWDMPIEEKCPYCGTQLSSRPARGGKQQIICPNRDCPGKKTGEKKTAKKSAAKTKTTKKQTKKQ